MRPDDPQMQHPSLFVPQRPHAPTPTSRSTQPAHQAAAADMARDQIDAIYEGDPNSLMAIEAEPMTVSDHKPTGAYVDEQIAESEAAPQGEANEQPPQAHSVITDRKQQYTPEAAHEPPAVEMPEAAPTNPYERTHDESKLKSDDSSWKEYHSAWQRYYQEYFHRYYSSHLLQTRAAYEQQSQRVTELESQPTPADVTPEEAMDDLRSKLRSQVAEKSKRVRKSRHFVPVAAAMAVMLIFVFLQYNRIIVGNVAAYVSPGNIEPENIIVDPNMELSVSKESRLIIPKINVDVPVIYENTMGDTQEQTHDRQMAAMENGVAWFGIPGADSKPGQLGNTVLSGHSSNDWFDYGEYKFIFARLERLKEGDVIYTNYQGTRYTYTITGTEVVLPTALDSLRNRATKPMLTLITCTPLGTSEKRLLVFAEQVSPDPAAARDAPASSASDEPVEIPGVRSSFLGGLLD